MFNINLIHITLHFSHNIYIHWENPKIYTFIGEIPRYKTLTSTNVIELAKTESKLTSLN